MRNAILGTLALGLVALALVWFLYLPAHTCSREERRAADLLVMLYEIDLNNYRALDSAIARRGTYTTDDLVKGAVLLGRIRDFEQPRCGDEPLDIRDLLR